MARRYRLIDQIGAGGMSTVWRAHDVVLGRDVAVKVPVTGLVAEHRAHLHREAQYAARIDHPSAVEVYDAGETITDGGRIVPFTVMPLVGGPLLAQRLDDGPLPWRDAVGTVAVIADVLASAHRQHLIHEDVTPENIILADHGPALLDFGLSATAGSAVARIRYHGTPPYVAPERLAGGSAAPAHDVYSLGVLLYHALTGRRPFPGDTWAELASADRSVPPPLPWARRRIPRRVAQICRECLAAAPSERPSAARVAEVLRASLTRSRAGVYAGVLAAGVAGAIAVTVVDGDRPAPGERTGAPASIVRASPTPTSTPKPTPTPTPPPEPEAAGQPADPLASLHGTLDDATLAGDVRSDVALDIAQLAENLVRSDVDDAAPNLASLRQKLDDRLREGGITRDTWEALHADLTLFADSR
jgi:serine/threonine protein kinase